MGSLPISAGLIEWARSAGYSYSIESPGGASIFWTEGGEDRIYLRPASEMPGWVTATEASRSGDESYFYEADSLDVAERYLWGFFGAIFRDLQRMPRLPIPINIDAVADPYRIESHNGTHILLRVNVPIMRAGPDITDIAVLVRTSYWLKVTVEDLERAYRDPEGRPLFSLGG